MNLYHVEQISGSSPSGAAFPFKSIKYQSTYSRPGAFRWPWYYWVPGAFPTKLTFQPSLGRYKTGKNKAG